MHYAQRLLAARPTTGAGARTILAVLTAFGIVTTTAGVAAMPLLTGNEVVNDTGARTDCRPAARMVYPEGQSAPEYVVPVYETGSMGGVDAVLSDWCSTAGNVLEDPSITLNVVEGQTVTPHLLPGIKAELERPAPANGEQDVFIPTDYLVRGMRQATGDSGWEVGKRVFSLTFSSGTVSATTGLFSFVKQDPGIIKPPSPEPTSEPTAEPTEEPTTEPTAEPTPTSTPEPGPTEEPTTEPTTEPTQSPVPTATSSPSPSPSSGPVPSQTPTNEACQAEPTATVLNPDGSDPQGSQPAYTPEHSIRISGSGWCENGAVLDGDKPIEIKLIAYGGYRYPGTDSLPVTFTKGSFDARINLSSLAGGAGLTTGRYYLQVSLLGSGLTRSTNVFGYEAPVGPEPTPAPTPTATPTQEPTAEPSESASPSPSVEPTTDPTAEPTTEPSSGPSGSPSTEPSAQPSSSAAPEPSSGPAPSVPDQGGLNPGSTSDQGNGSGGGSGSGAGDGSASNGASRAASGSGESGAGSSAAGGPGGPAGPGADRGQDQQSGQRGGEAGSSDSENSEGVEEPAQAPASATAEDRTARPDRNPVPPVTSAAQLSADNAGSLSGSRQGNIVSLVLPRAKASVGDWVSVFVFPGATTKGWVQVDGANSVSIDISTFESGSYELAVADRDNSLLGWAKLEITSASFDPRSPSQAQLLTFPDKATTSSTGLSANDMLLGGAGGLLVIGAGSLLVAARSGLPLRAARTPRRLRVPRRR